MKLDLNDTIDALLLDKYLGVHYTSHEWEKPKEGETGFPLFCSLCCEIAAEQIRNARSQTDSHSAREFILAMLDELQQEQDDV